MTDAPTRTIRTRYATAEFHPWGAMVRMEAGEPVFATPHQTTDYREITRRCGYGIDTLGFCHGHELGHLIVEQFIYDRPSRVLLGLATGRPLTAKDAVYEELAAQALQRFVQTGERPIVKAPWMEMRAAFIEALNA